MTLMAKRKISIEMEMVSLSRKAVTTALADNRIRNVDGWLFAYDLEELYKGLKEYLEKNDVQVA